MRVPIISLVLVLAWSAAATAGETVRLDLDGVPRLSAKLPKGQFEPRLFKHGDLGVGWVVRVPVGRRREDERSRLADTFPSPTVFRGRVFVGGGLSSRRFSALDAATGKRLWSAALEDNGPSPSAVTPERVVTGTESCTTYGFNPRTGAREWARWLGPNIYAAPTIVGSTVVMAYHKKTEVEGEDGGFGLTALRLDDGEPVWEVPLEHDLYGAPIFALGRIFVTPRSGEVLCLSKTGEALWRTPRISARSAPWLGSSGLYVTVATGRGLTVVALDPVTGNRLWESDPVGAPRHLREQSTVTAVPRPTPPHGNGWCCDPPRPAETAAGVVLAECADLMVLDPASGKVVRRVRLPEGSAFSAPPAVLGDRLLFATLDGMLLEIDPGTGALRRALNVGVRLTSQPVVAKRRVHLAAEEFVFGIPWGAKREKRMPDWPEWGGGPTRTGR
jgi:outer membrane protein assembly factor BamB